MAPKRQFPSSSDGTGPSRPPKRPKSVSCLTEKATDDYMLKLEAMIRKQDHKTEELRAEIRRQNCKIEELQAEVNELKDKLDMPDSAESSNKEYMGSPNASQHTPAYSMFSSPLNEDDFIELLCQFEVDQDQPYDQNNYKAGSIFKAVHFVVGLLKHVRKGHSAD